MAYTLDLPLIDAGTNGFNASSASYLKDKGPCYECLQRKGAVESFPACTIRQKPEKLIHCIVWAKFLYDGLFGPRE
jgi:ubiquitin-like 1-activating enzyme E1 B